MHTWTQRIVEPKTVGFEILLDSHVLRTQEYLDQAPCQTHMYLSSVLMSF